ncbi:MAG: SMC-Scp complex subunit ScpB [Phycisphaerae bacterium]|jgi:segregation and condensation protein B
MEDIALREASDALAESSTRSPAVENDGPLSALPVASAEEAGGALRLAEAPAASLDVGDQPAAPVPACVPDAPTPESLIEALLFASDTPLSAARLAELLGGATDVRGHIEALNEKYARAGLSFRIEPIARGYQMMTLPAYRPWLNKLQKQRSETRLGEAALETLSIIAYKQPVIRAEIDAIRGVSCSEVVGRLREMGLVRVVGRAEVVGRPLLYGTTRKFLDVFGLADLDELPPMEALKLRPRPALAEVAAAEPPVVERHAVAGA